MVEPVRIAGKTRTVGLDQDCVPLHIRDFVYSDGTPAMKAAFKFSAEDLVRALNGGLLEVTILGTAWPFILIEVGDDVASAID